MRFGSLFSGIGGLDLGLERAGMECAWQVEIEPYCLKVLEKHWPEVKRYGNVKEIEWGWVEPVDLICGGFPCQPFSVAGKRRGAADERNLWPEMLRAIRGVRPCWVLGENVPGLGSYLDTICSDLEGEGYEVLPLEIPAAAFGAPHLRYRLFIVAHTQCSQQVGTEHVAHTTRPREWAEQELSREGVRPLNGREVVADANHAGLSGGMSPRPNNERQENECGGDRSPHHESNRQGWWDIEPDVGRVAHGVPHRVDRLRCLGNAVVPQVAEWLGRRILNDLS